MALPKWIARRLWRGVIEFDMLEPGDRVLVGLSGGKDSSFLLYALSSLKESSPFSFDLAAMHVDQGFVPDFDLSPLVKLCERLGVPFYVQRTRIFAAVKGNTRQNPCARCAFLRRGVMNNFARQEGFNRVALAHHLDDAVETLLLSLFYSGRLTTFQPRSYLDRSDVMVIRPLVYFREREIIKAGELLDYTPVDTPCPVAGRSMRARVKELIRSLERENGYIFFNLAAAMREGAALSRWPARPASKELRQKIAAFWGREGRN